MRILCVEDDLIIRNFIVKKCKLFGETIACEDLEQARDILKNQSFDFALIDLNLKDEEELDGLKVLCLCKEKGIKSAILTGHEDKNIIEQAFTLGADQYFSKVELSENIDYLLHSFLKIEQKNSYQSLFTKKYITRHEPLISSIEFAIEQSKFNKQNILITGPTGVGKTKVAEIIHHLSHPDSPFISKNLNEINENLLESELFGHKKGAFTGATENKKGLLEMANGGTLFLDEIASIPLIIQKKLLKVIEERKFTPVGAEKAKEVNFHLITATCDDIEQRIEKGELRVDFYFRIKGMEIHIPPLNERKYDIVPLIDFTIATSPKKIHFSKEVIDRFINYEWPGNIRELIEAVKLLINQCNGLININDIPNSLFKSSEQEEKDSHTFLTPKNYSYLKENGLPALVKAIENEAFLKAKEELGDKINQISRELRISKSVYYRLASEAK